MSASRNTSAHDEFFKAIFTDVRHARDLLQGVLSPDILAVIDLQDLELEQTSYVSEALRESCTDLVFSCQCHGNPTIVAILLEHKSWEPSYPHLQILRYMLSIWEQNLADSLPLRLVIPILIHQGEHRWDVKPFPESFPHLPAPLHRFVPTFELVYEDLVTATADELQSHFHDAVVQTALVTMKFTSSKNAEGMLELARNLSPDLGDLPPDEAMRTLRQLLEYIFKSNDTALRKALLARLSPTLKGSTMTIAESWIQEGIERGTRNKALDDARKMREHGIDWHIITDVTGIKPEDLDVA
jgi:predicted transposase YdaD